MKNKKEPTSQTQIKSHSEFIITYYDRQQIVPVGMVFNLEDITDCHLENCGEFYVSENGDVKIPKNEYSKYLEYFENEDLF